MTSRRLATRLGTSLLAALVLAQPALVPGVHAYVLNRNIAAAGSCPVPQRWAASTPNIVDRRWNTAIPVVNGVPTVSTDTSTGETATVQINRAILNSFDVWTSVGTSLTPQSLGPLNQVTGQTTCSFSDGLNTICFNQPDTVGFQTGVLAFTRVNSADTIGFVLGTNPPTTIIGEIVDADIQFRPDGAFNFATREALAAHPSSFDLESVLTHEIGHFFGFSHSAVLRAMMYPFAAEQGSFTGGVRCPAFTGSNPPCDAPLGDDDRAGLRVLYPNANDPNIGVISGFILPTNPMSLAGLASPSAGRSVTGIFGAHVVAVDAATGAVVAGTFGGWSCDPNNRPSKFDGFYKIEGLPVGRSYKIFVEPLDGPTNAANIQVAIDALCSQNGPLDVCTPPAVNTNFTTKIKPN